MCQLHLVGCVDGPDKFVERHGTFSELFAQGTREALQLLQFALVPGNVLARCKHGLRRTVVEIDRRDLTYPLPAREREGYLHKLVAFIPFRQEMFRPAECLVLR